MKIILNTYRPSFFSYIGYAILFLYFSIVFLFSYKKENDKTIIQLKNDNILDEVRIIVLVLAILFLCLFIRFIKRNIKNYSEISINDDVIMIKFKGKTKTIKIEEYKKCTISSSRKLLSSTKTDLIKEYDIQLKSAITNIGYILQIIGKKKVKITNIKEEEYDKICEFIESVNKLSKQNTGN